MKKCTYTNCPWPVFGTDKNTNKGYCKKHQYLRSDLKRKINRGTAGQRRKKILNNKYGFDPFQWGHDKEIDMFAQLWGESNKKSQLSGRDLSSFEIVKNWVSCFAHVLDKKNYPLYRYNPENILIIHPFEHYLVDFGSVSQRIDYFEFFPKTDFNIFYDLREKLKKSYFSIKRIPRENDNQ